MARKVGKVKRREKRAVVEGNAYIQSTFNNTIVSITDLNGDVVGWASSGSSDLKGRKKARPSRRSWRRKMSHGAPPTRG